MVARTTLSRDGHTILNHSPRTDFKNSSIFFIKNCLNYVIFLTIILAGAEGIEPSSAVLETDILPLNYAPLNILNPSDVPHANTIVCDTIAHVYKKSSGNIIIFFKKSRKNIFMRNFFIHWTKFVKFYLRDIYIFFYNQLNKGGGIRARQHKTANFTI